MMLWLSRIWWTDQSHFISKIAGGPKAQSGLVHRTVTVAGNGAGGFHCSAVVNSSPNVGPIDYFIPAGTYRGRGGATNAAPLSYVFRRKILPRR